MTLTDLVVFGEYVSSQETALENLKGDPNLKKQTEALGKNFHELVNSLERVVTAMGTAHEILEALFEGKPVRQDSNGNLYVDE